MKRFIFCLALVIGAHGVTRSIVAQALIGGGANIGGGSNIGSVAGGGGGGGGGLTGDKLTENAEGTGYDETQAGTWSENIGTGGSINEDNATSPLKDAQDILIVAGNAGQNSFDRYDVGADQNEGFIRLKFNIDALPTSGDMALVRLRDSGDTTRCEVMLRPVANGQTVKIDANGTGQASTGATYTFGTTYWLWIHYKNDGTGSVAFSTTSTEPTSGSNYAPYTGGDTSAIRKIDLRADDQRTVHFDNILWNTTSIGSGT